MPHMPANGGGGNNIIRIWNAVDYQKYALLTDTKGKRNDFIALGDDAGEHIIHIISCDHIKTTGRKSPNNCEMSLT